MIFVTSLLLATIRFGDCLPQNDGSTNLNSTVPRIFGEDIAPTEYQGYQVAILIEGQAQPFLCGGSIISSKHVLTAAHCIDNPKNPYFYKLLYGRIGSSTWSTGGKKINFENHTIHPLWSHVTSMYDVGIFTVRETIEFNDKIKPIALSYEPVKSGDVAYVTGWGITENGVLSEDLKITKVKVVGYKSCDIWFLKRKFFYDVYSFNNEVNICTYSYGTGTCGGDSGGALVKDGYQIGIVSWGHAICAFVPDVHAKISGLKDFIEPIIAGY